MKKNFTASLFFTLLSLVASAQTTTSIPDNYPSLGRGIRPLGMGNAFLSMKGTDDNALYYNPAAINDFDRNIDFRMPSPIVDFNTGMIDTVKDVFDLADDLDKETSDSGKTTTFNTFFNNHVGDFNSVNLLLPFFGVQHKRIAASVVLDSRSTISLRNRAFPNFELKTRNDGGVIVGGAHGFFFDDLQVGAAVKFLYRVGLEEIITMNDILAGSLDSQIGLDQWKKGFGVGGDVGVKYKVYDFESSVMEFLQPTVAATWQDVGNTRFSGGAPNTRQSMSAGFGIHPELGPAQFSILADFREINQKQDLMKKMHAGVEARFKELLFTETAIRGGVNQGYPTAGLSLDWPVFGIDVAFYGEEVGKTTRQKAVYHLATALNFVF